MSFYETIITVDAITDNSPLSDFGIVSIKSSHSRSMICKVKQHNKLKYFSYYPKTVMELYLFLESKGLVTKTATLQDQRVYFCRGKDLLQIFKDNEKYVSNKLREINGGSNDCSINTFYKLYFKKLF